MTEIIKRLNDGLTALEHGDPSIVNDEVVRTQASFIAVDLINNNNWNTAEQEIARLIIRISNIMYNNMSDELTLLDDGVYDQLIVKAKKYGIEMVGAPPIVFNENPSNDIIDEKIMVSTITDESKLYVKDIHDQIVPFRQTRPVNMCFIVRDPISKRLIEVKHNYPELVGTLDKCKFVLNEEARIQGVFDKDSVKVFERDFIHKIMDKGIVHPNEEFDVVCELKYDGVSVEAEIKGDTIISALSRGDTADNVAADLTPIFGGYRFPFASDIPKDEVFGMKFEAVVLERDLEMLGRLRGKSYKNCRNCVIGLLGSSDAYMYIDYITLIPIATSLNISRIDELNFINHFYHSGQYNKWMHFHGDYRQILFHVKQFVESAESIRSILPYMIDGVVVSLIDPNKIAALGRENSINKYQMAIKFNPKKVRTTFIGYTFNIGKSGEVIPMVHFKPCEFIGAIHTKQTLHSYQRFKELNLIKGQDIDIEYRNDVITYITKPDTERNRTIIGEPEPFITHCPYCGAQILISDTGKSAKCPNPYCGERSIMRMVDMIDRLGFKDFSEQTVRSIGLRSLVDLFNINANDISFIGPNESIAFIENINRLRDNPIPDYKILSALGFDGIADEKWKTILREVTYREILDMDKDQLYQKLISIKSIGPGIAASIINYREIYKGDLMIALAYLNIIDSKGTKSLPKVSFTGFRNPELVELLKQHGFDAGEYGVTNETVALIAADPNGTSGKIKKARDKGIPIYTIDEFLKCNNIKI